VSSTEYTYQAVRGDGLTESGTVSAPSREDAVASLARRGLFPMKLEIVAGGASRRTRIASRDLAVGLRALATLLDAGLPMGRALAAFSELAPPAWRSALPAIQTSVREGQGLSSALAAAPVQVPALVVGMIRAGEGGSGVAQAVRRAAELTERAAATQATVRGALAYPIILGVAGAASLALLVGVVLPRFAVILADLGQALPPSTRLVLGAAATARRAAAPGAVGLVVATVLWRAWTATDDGRAEWDALLLRIPGVGRARLSSSTARVAAALAGLLENGVPLASAVVHAARAAGDAAVARRLLSAREQVVAGGRFGAAVEAQRALTPTAVRLVRAGEETGRLAAMLAHAAQLEGARAESIVKGAVRLIEPLLILGFGGLIALVAGALLQAIYSVRPGA
jgi:general secretion pathway protein F